MLLEISIKNFAIIKEISLQFREGMTVLTGETGAGKSIIIDAMNMMLGARAQTDMIRKGAPKAELEGLFNVEASPVLVQLFEEQGMEFNPELIIRREIFANGRSVSRINGQLVTLSFLKEIGSYLVDIHGQHDQESLMKASKHQELLDSFGQADFFQLKGRYQEAFDHYKTLRKRFIDLQKNQQEHQARIEMLEFQLAEIEAASLENNEDKLLEAEREKILNSKKISDALTSSLAALDDPDFSSLEQLRRAMNEMQSLEDYDPQYKKLSEALSETYFVLEDVAKDLEGHVERLDYHPNRLLEIEARLDLVYSISRKYGGSLDQALSYYDNALKEYQLLTGQDSDDQTLEESLKQAEKNLLGLAQELSQAREELAHLLEEEIHQELRDLYMDKAQFKVMMTAAKFNRQGNQQIEFFISTNLGEDLKPLVKVASGGELSRLMLAIKTALARRANKTSIVFDEVDTGVSGRVAQAIAQKIHRIGQFGQVLAISHLPQVIAIADYQFFIEKIADQDSTVSQVRLLSPEERIQEVAKMLAGDNVSQAALVQARELIEQKK